MNTNSKRKAARAAKQHSERRIAKRAQDRDDKLHQKFLSRRTSNG